MNSKILMKTRELPTLRTDTVSGAEGEGGLNEATRSQVD